MTSQAETFSRSAHPVEQRTVGPGNDRQVGQVEEHLLGPGRSQHAAGHPRSRRGADLDVKQSRSVGGDLIAEGVSDCLARGRAEQQLDEGTGVERR
ncbi:MAG: hypothetical protein QOF77_696 [Solirubrobacteraceae bacterium]|jgi:hypothetical protein|nr:hypothetical protein [Solirubrobacteraceae bacterium]